MSFEILWGCGGSLLRVAPPSLILEQSPHLNLEDDVGVPHNESLKDSFHREQKSVLLAMSVDVSAPGSGMNDFCCAAPPLVGGAAVAEHW